MTASPLRLMPAACAAWLVSILLVAPSAREQRAAPVPRADRPLFSHSEDCVACHNALETPSGDDVSIGTMWQATMMANSARDPYWQAAVRREVQDHPTRAADIQDECATCHMPMSRRTASALGSKGQVFAHLPVASGPRAPLDRLAADGVSCTVCHQMAAETLGRRESFNGNFVMPPAPPDGARLIFGPHLVDAGRKTIMRSVSGFVQAEAPHIKQSELCASCHTLITEAFDEQGRVIGSLPEQMNYLEWQHSDFNAEERSCQSCHMPVVQGPVRIASVLGDVRDTLARHVFVGGNAYMLRLLDRYRTELGVSAPSHALESTARATIRQLKDETATVAIALPRLAEDRLTFAVDVGNLTGHKFPTGYPSRRAWLHVTVRDGLGARVFESGAIDERGAIHGNDGDREPGAFEPHYEQIASEDQVQIYEPILGDPRGVPTTGLLTATHYLKDNRLLPRGFDKATATAEIAVYGGAAHDEDFTGAGDRVRYAVAVAGDGPFSIDVELRYQPIGYRWAHNLDRYDAPETNRFVSYFNATSRESSVVVAAAATRLHLSAARSRSQRRVPALTDTLDGDR